MGYGASQRQARIAGPTFSAYSRQALAVMGKTEGRGQDWQCVRVLHAFQRIPLCRVIARNDRADASSAAQWTRLGHHRLATTSPIRSRFDDDGLA